MADRANGCDPDRIRWVIPRDAWMVNRLSAQCGPEFYRSTVRFVADQQEACATATDVDYLFVRFEACGWCLRLDDQVWPTMFHAGTISEGELEQCRLVHDVVRLAECVRLRRTH